MSLAPQPGTRPRSSGSQARSTPRNRVTNSSDAQQKAAQAAVFVGDNIKESFSSPSIPSPFDTSFLGRVIEAVFYAIACLCEIDPARSESLPGRLSDLLGEVDQENTVQSARESRPLPEGEIAALAAELISGDCWLLFATSDNDDTTLKSMADRALELYGLTETWITDADDDSTPEAAIAAGRRLVRGGGPRR